MQLPGINAVVTGGSSGLGAAVCSALVTRGATVTIVDQAPPGAEVMAALGEAAQFAAADVTDEPSFTAALDEAASRGPVRALVHCAGRGGDRLRILDKDGSPNSLEAFGEMLRINLVGTYNALRLTAARMAANELVDGERGAVVLTASVAAFDGQIGQTSYAASKAGVHGMTLVAARDLASRHIRVNTIAPGLFDTAMLQRLREDIRQSLGEAVPHPRRLGEPDEYAHMALALLENSYANAATIRLDGAIRMPPR